MPMRVMSLPEHLLHEPVSGLNVLDARGAGFALDRQRAGEPALESVAKNARQSTSPVPTTTSSPQVPGVLVRLASLMWHDATCGSKRVQPRDGVALVVQDQIGRIEVDADVRTIERVEETPERLSLLLARFEATRQPVIGKQVRDLLEAAWSAWRSPGRSDRAAETRRET